MSEYNRMRDLIAGLEIFQGHGEKSVCAEHDVIYAGPSALGTGEFDLNRHRLFETSFGMLTPPCQHRRGQTIGVYGNGTNSYHRAKFGRCVRAAELREAMGIDWMTRKELSQAIPPAYTEFIGKELMRVLNAVAGSGAETPPQPETEK